MNILNIEVLMKRIIILLLLVFGLCGCSINNTAKGTIELYFQSYNELSNEVLNDMNKVVESENYTAEEKELYKDILKRQYQDLKYEILSESYNGDTASVSAKIEVYDYYSVQKQAQDYLKNNINAFYKDGKYDNNKYLNYKFNLLKNTEERVNYNIDFNLVRENDLWVLKEILPSDLEKIHGIYNYEIN